MSTSSLGASRVGAVITSLAAAGYRCARISASGQRRGSRRDERCLAGDRIALATAHGYPHLLVEVGGVGKRLGVAFAELKASRSQLLEAAEKSAEPSVRRAIQEAVADAPSSDQVA